MKLTKPQRRVLQFIADNPGGGERQDVVDRLTERGLLRYPGNPAPWYTREITEDGRAALAGGEVR